MEGKAGVSIHKHVSQASERSRGAQVGSSLSVVRLRICATLTFCVILVGNEIVREGPELCLSWYQCIRCTDPDVRLA